MAKLKFDDERSRMVETISTDTIERCRATVESIHTISPDVANHSDCLGIARDRI